MLPWTQSGNIGPIGYTINSFSKSAYLPIFKILIAIESQILCSL